MNDLFPWALPRTVWMIVPFIALTAGTIFVYTAAILLAVRVVLS